MLGRVEKYFDASNMIVYNVIDFPWPAADRDAVMKTETRVTNETGEIIITSKAMAEAHWPQVRNQVRTDKLIQQFVLEFIEKEDVMKKTTWLCTIVFIIAAMALTGCDIPVDPDPPEVRPIVFVHGGAGSADQFQSQALRFASNGYPAEFITGFEYDSSMMNNTQEEVMAALDAHIDALLEATGADQVDLLGHSYGSFMSAAYMSDPERAARVAHYVNLDGFVTTEDGDATAEFSCEECYGITVPILAIWASMSGLEGRQVVDAVDNILLMGTTHVEAASHPDAFYHMYRFFNDGEEPKTTDILPSESEDIELAGKVIHFITNLTPRNHKVELYEIDGDTGARLNASPLQVSTMAADGGFGPFHVKREKHYEFYIYNPRMMTRTSVHYYYEPFLRSDYMIRLKTAPAFGLINMVLERDRGPAHSGLAVVRNKEFVADAADLPAEQQMSNDSLVINGTELCLPEMTPADTNTIGLFVYDFGADGVDDLTGSMSVFGYVPFVGGADLVMPASTVQPPDGTITIEVQARVRDQTAGKKQVIHIPNYPSSEDRMMVQFNDWVQ